MKKLVRYKNRKLYDAEQGGYVNLRQVSSWIKDRKVVSVKCNVTKMDITPKILNQLLFMEADKLTPEQKIALIQSGESVTLN